MGRWAGGQGVLSTARDSTASPTSVCFGLAWPALPLPLIPEWRGSREKVPSAPDYRLAISARSPPLILILPSVSGSDTALQSVLDPQVTHLQVS
ncbi:hypothetical protein AAFF_G00252330 [Aldrovandia affinis]|uniref:Uncharacterized protein n=1 Tax=Aldrovandia affinis TaxID=143900 RepID=A0AAD7WTL1_9TELE|nr:hypothetical protein AAFF_G00252330 [Aldrovandia affinis]